MQTRNWEDDNGQKHYITEIVAEEAYFADSKRENNESNPFDEFGSQPTTFRNFEDVSDNDDLPFW